MRNTIRFVNSKTAINNLNSIIRLQKANNDKIWIAVCHRKIDKMFRAEVTFSAPYFTDDGLSISITAEAIHSFRDVTPISDNLKTCMGDSIGVFYSINAEDWTQVNADMIEMGNFGVDPEPRFDMFDYMTAEEALKLKKGFDAMPFGISPDGIEVKPYSGELSEEEKDWCEKHRSDFKEELMTGKCETCMHRIVCGIKEERKKYEAEIWRNMPGIHEHFSANAECREYNEETK